MVGISVVPTQSEELYDYNLYNYIDCTIAM